MITTTMSSSPSLSERSRRARRALLSSSCLGLILGPLASQEESGWSYDSGRNGLEWTNPDSGSYLWLGLRGQFRLSTLENEPRVIGDFAKEQSTETNVNRARYKVGAGIGEQMTLYHEYDLRNKKLLDLRGTIKPATWLNIRA